MNFIKIKLNYVSNFSPNFKRTTLNKNKKIFIKNILLFLYVLQFKKNNLKVSIFIKPILKKNFLILRAPYRYKLGRLNIGIIRYNTSISITIPNSNGRKVFAESQLNTLKKLPTILESSMLHLHKFTITIPTCFKKNFFLKNF